MQLQGPFIELQTNRHFVKCGNLYSENVIFKSHFMQFSA